MYKTIYYQSYLGKVYNFEVQNIFEINSKKFKFFLTNIENNKTSIISKNDPNEIELKTDDLVNEDKSLLFSMLSSLNWD